MQHTGSSEQIMKQSNKGKESRNKDKYLWWLSISFLTMVMF